MFSAQMVLALLREAKVPGTGKTMTRRLAWREIEESCFEDEYKGTDDWGKTRTALKPSPWQRVEVGDRLWVRENFFAFGRWIGGKKGGKVTYSFARCARPGPDGNLIFAAGFENRHPLPLGVFGSYDPAWHLRPNIFLPREHSRLTLVVTAKKIERLQKITDADVRAEGVPQAMIKKWEKWLHKNDCPGKAFGELWDSLHGAGSWDTNPECVALSFTVHAKNIDAMKEAA